MLTEKVFYLLPFFALSAFAATRRLIFSLFSFPFTETEILMEAAVKAASPTKRQSAKKKRSAVEEAPADVKERFRGEVSALKRSHSGSRKPVKTPQTPVEDLPSLVLQETSREPMTSGKRSKNSVVSGATAFPLTSSTTGTSSLGKSTPPMIVTAVPAGIPKLKPPFREVSVELKPPPSEPKKAYFFVQADLSDDSSEVEYDESQPTRRDRMDTGSTVRFLSESRFFVHAVQVNLLKSKWDGLVFFTHFLHSGTLILH